MKIKITTPPQKKERGPLMCIVENEFIACKYFFYFKHLLFQINDTKSLTYGETDLKKYEKDGEKIVLKKTCKYICNRVSRFQHFLMKWVTFRDTKQKKILILIHTDVCSVWCKFPKVRNAKDRKNTDQIHISFGRRTRKKDREKYENQKQLATLGGSKIRKMMKKWSWSSKNDPLKSFLRIFCQQVL